MSHPDSAGSKLSPHISGRRLLTSSELVARLQGQGLSEQNARQFIRRHSNVNGVWRSEKLRLARDERLFADSSFVGCPDFYVAVGKKLMETSRQGLGRCLIALGKVHILNKIEAMRLLAVCDRAAGSHAPNHASRLYQHELEGLHELGVRVIHPGTNFESLVSPTMPDDDDADAIAAIAAERLRSEALLARILLERLRRQNLVTWNRVELPDLEVPFTVFNGQIFSGFGFSYLSPLVQWKKGTTRPTSCPLLLDCYRDGASLAHVQSFAQRVSRAIHRGRSRIPALSVIAARDFEKDAWVDARSRGFMTINLRQVFGEEALDAMVLVERILHGASLRTEAESESNFQKFSQLLLELKTNPIVVTLRSIGFEALAGLILRSCGYEQVEMGRAVPWEKSTRDIDVFAFRGDELRVIECKAYHRRKSIPGEEVRKFFTQTLPALKQWLHESKRKFVRCTAEIWTTGPLGNEARDELYRLKAPKGDKWDIKRMEEVEAMIPSAIKRRSVELLRSISITDLDEGAE